MLCYYNDGHVHATMNQSRFDACENTIYTIIHHDLTDLYNEQVPNMYNNIECIVNNIIIYCIPVIILPILIQYVCNNNNIKRSLIRILCFFSPSLGDKLIDIDGQWETRLSGYVRNILKKKKLRTDANDISTTHPLLVALHTVRCNLFRFFYWSSTMTAVEVVNYAQSLSVHKTVKYMF